jgi:short-subunit dehydrogenase
MSQSMSEPRSGRRLALVTGAAGGIGREVSRRLASRGYVVLAVERDEALAAAAAAAIAGDAVPVPCDLTDRTAVSKLSERIEKEWAGELELVVLNAGVIIPGDVLDSSADVLRLQLDVMLGSVMELAAASARALTPKGSGHILATVSTGGILALPGSAAYSAAKAGLRAFLAALSAELRGTGVAVSGIYPSAVDTPMLLHEATHGGSLLNFVGTVSSIKSVADRYDRALRTRRLETFIPYSDSLLVRFLECVPWLVPWLLRPMNALGRRGRQRYLARKNLSSAHTERSTASTP